MLMEYLTGPGRKLLAAAKESPDTQFAFVNEGIIMEKRSKGQFVKVQNTDDLLHLGMEEVDYVDFYRYVE